MDGTFAYPYIVVLNLDKPERNWGFEVSLVRNIEHRNFTRDAYHIRKTSTLSQEADWNAYVPLKQYPALAGRAVLIRGPSQDFWHQKASRYHQEMKCDKTKTVHETLETQISNDTNRRYSFWLLVFPKGTELENHILSDDAVNVKKHYNDLVESVKLNEGEDDEEEVELLGLDIYWRIATKGGEMIRSPDAVKRKSRFAQRKNKGTKDEFHDVDG